MRSWRQGKKLEVAQRSRSNRVVAFDIRFHTFYPGHAGEQKRKAGPLPNGPPDTVSA